MISRLVVSVVAMSVAAMSVATACATSTGTAPTGRSTLPSSASESASSEPTSAARSTTAGAPSVPTQRTAEQDLAPFLALARQADTGLQRAATLVNAGIGSDTVGVDQAIVNAVRAADPEAAARAVPVGLDPKLLRGVLVVYNDLVARHAAMSYFRTPARYTRKEARSMLECLAHGAAPAARFAADLASLQRYARSQPASTADRGEWTWFAPAG